MLAKFLTEFGRRGLVAKVLAARFAQLNRHFSQEIFRKCHIWHFLEENRKTKQYQASTRVSLERQSDVERPYALGEPILRMTGVDGQHASAGFALP